MAKPDRRAALASGSPAVTAAGRAVSARRLNRRGPFIAPGTSGSMAVSVGVIRGCTPQPHLAGTIV